jgi:hypothetical protein
VLQSDARIVEVAPPPGSKAAARAWALKDANGTGKDGQQTSDPGEYLPASGEALERLVRATVDRRLADVLEGLMSGPS